MNIIYEKWDEILETVKTEHELSDVSFKTWLKPLTIHSIDDQVVTILVPSQQVGLNYISKKYALPLKVAISELTGSDYDIKFVLPEDIQNVEKEVPVSTNYNTSKPESKIHLRYLCRRKQQQICPCCIPGRGRISGRNLQSSLFIWRCWSWKDSSDAFRCTLYIRKKSFHQDSVYHQ